MAEWFSGKVGFSGCTYVWESVCVYGDVYVCVCVSMWWVDGDAASTRWLTKCSLNHWPLWQLVGYLIGSIAGAP